MKWKWDWPEGAYALRLVLAAFLAFVVARLLGDAHGYSAVFSAIIVTRPYQQGALKAGAYRLLGTIGGIAMAFVAVWLRRTGLNDYELLLLTLVPLSIAAAYDQSYRTSLISALIMLSAPMAQVPELKVALARAGVVTLGAVIGIAVSMLVLPQRHDRVAGIKAARVTTLLLAQMKDALGQPDFRRADIGDGRVRKLLLELGQAGRDHRPGKDNEHNSARIIGLTRHLQSVAVLLRGHWRSLDLDEAGRTARSALCDSYLGFAASLKDLSRGRAAPASEAIKPVFGAIRRLEADPHEQWLLELVARDLAGLAKLIPGHF